MSKWMLRIVGAALLTLTLGVISCQTLFSGTTGLPNYRVEHSAR